MNRLLVAIVASVALAGCSLILPEAETPAQRWYVTESGYQSAARTATVAIESGLLSSSTIAIIKETDRDWAFPIVSAGNALTRQAIEKGDLDVEASLEFCNQFAIQDLYDACIAIVAAKNPAELDVYSHLLAIVIRRLEQYAAAHGGTS